MRAALAVFVSAAFLCGPAFATQTSSIATGGGGAAAHTSGAGSGGAHSVSGVGHGGAPAVAAMHHGAAHAVSAHAASSAAHGHHHHHHHVASQVNETAFNNTQNFGAGPCYPHARVAGGKSSHDACGNPGKLAIDEKTGAPVVQ